MSEERKSNDYSLKFEIQNILIMQTLHFEIEINSSVTQVYDAMLGISKSTYEQWTSKFNPTSTYNGNWNQGSKIHFLGTNEQGDIGGMVSEIVENIPNRFVSIKHYGLLAGNNEITEGPEVEKWAGGFENYTFIGNENQTTVRVDVDTNEDFKDYMNNTFPKALEELKRSCEG
jgi:hypothetical protein